MAAEGGEIIPIEMSKGPAALDFTALKPVAAEPASGPAERKPIEVRGVAGGARPAAAPVQPPVPGVAAPAPATPEELAHLRLLDSCVNYEVNVYRICYHAVHEMVLMRVREEPADSEDIGNGTWGAGKRTPLEAAEPQVAIEVYRQVRASIRDEERAGKKSDLRALVTRIVTGLVGA